MNKVAIITDSTCDLTPEYVKEHNVHVIPLHVSFEGDPTDYLDGVNLTSLEIYEKVKQIGKTPKTGSLNANQFIEVAEPLIKEGYDIVFTGIGSTLSSTMNSVGIAAQEFPEGRIELIDSMNLSTGTGLLVNKMVELRDQGLSAKEIAEEVRLLVPRVSAKFVIDRMDYLHKGGRCSGLARFLLNAFKVHPICKVFNGKLTVAKVTMGAYRRGVMEQIKELKKDLENNDVDTSMIFITHSQCMDGEEEFAYQRVCELVGKDHCMVTHAGCVISSHCGPKTIGILYILKSNLVKK